MQVIATTGKMVQDCHSQARSQISCGQVYLLQVLKVCRTPRPTACSKTKMLHLDISTMVNVNLSNHTKAYKSKLLYNSMI